MATVYETQVVKRLPRQYKRIRKNGRLEADAEVQKRQKKSHIDWTDPRNFSVPVLAAFGLSDSYIRKKTGHTTARIHYRLKTLGLEKIRRQFRNNTGAFASKIINPHIPFVRGVMKDKIHRKLLKG